MLQRLAEFLNLEIDLKAYQGHYNQPDKARDLPSDELISTWRDKIPNQNWQWVFGMLATFGLRPHEAWFCEFEDPLTLNVLDGKTAERVASALYPDWVNKWDLENIQRPKLSCQTFQQYGERCCRQFNRYKVPFVPYDLRHAWALRAAVKFRLPETVAAKLMGHSVAVHYKTYHRWLSAIEQRQAYEEKRREVLSSLTHLIEIDLLRQGEPMVLTTGNVQSHYRILVSRAEQRPQADLYAFNVQNSMPRFPLPLASDEAEPIIDLQGLLNQVYDRAGYNLVIDYAEPPVPPLTEADAAWANELLHSGV